MMRGRISPEEKNKMLDWAWDVLGFEGSNPNHVPVPLTKEQQLVERKRKEKAKKKRDKKQKKIDKRAKKKRIMQKVKEMQNANK